MQANGAKLAATPRVRGDAPVLSPSTLLCSLNLWMATERAADSKPRGRRLSGLTETLFETLSEHLAADNSFTCAPEESNS